jgi:hypothetical protein
VDSGRELGPLFYQRKNLLGHESPAASRRYIDLAGQEARAAEIRNPLYGSGVGP